MRVLLATDGSESSEGAARFLRRLNFAAEDEITVFHAINWIPFQDDRESHYAGLRRFKETIAPKILDETVAIVAGSGAKVITALVEGAADAAIIEAGGRAGADLIVMGARGIKGMGAIFIGSVTRSVAINSPRPVLIIRPPQHKAAAPLKVLFATDGSEDAEATAALLGVIPFPPETELTVVNVVWSAVADIPDRYALELDNKVKDEVARARALENEMSGRIIDGTMTALSKRFGVVKSIARIGDPSLEILDVAKTEGSDVIALGSRGMKGLRGMLGSVSRRILGNADCSVLICKARGG